MARREADVVITAEGRDQGGIFHLKEMPPMQASDWCMRAMQFLVRSGMDVPPTLFEAGPAGFFAIGIGTALAGLAKSPWYEVKPLLSELLDCVVSYQPPGGQVPIVSWKVIESQIEEITTIYKLYEEVVSLSLGFSLAERLLSYRETVTAILSGFMPNTETSTELPPSSSEAVSLN